MRICSYILPTGTRSYGVMDDDGILDAGPDLRREFPDFRSILTGSALNHLRDAKIGVRLAVSDVTLTPPITNPDKIICVGLNYMSHIKETGRDTPKFPPIFIRHASSLVGHGEALRMPSVSDQFDYEGELAIVIGKSAHNLGVNEAMSIVSGYACFNDGSVRDYQRHTSQFWAGKNFIASGSMGPCLTLCEEVTDYTQCVLKTILNDVIVQEVSLSDLAFDVANLVSYISSVTELLPGDIIATGTPAGVGMFRTPQLWLKPGDKIAVEVSGVGRLENKVQS